MDLISSKYLFVFQSRKYFIFLLFLFISCQNTNSLHGGRIVLSGFTWELNEDDADYVFLGRYLEMDSNGECLIMRRSRWNGKMEYYKKNLGPKYFQTLADGITSLNLDTSYLPSVEIKGCYNGFSYLLQTNYGNSSRKTLYSVYPPIELENISEELDSIIDAANLPLEDSIELGKHVEFLTNTTKDSSLLPPRIKSTQFLPPIVKDGK